MKFFHVTLRFLFGIALVGLALKGLLEIKTQESFVSQVIDQFQMKILKTDAIKSLKEHTLTIVYIENFCFLAAGLLAMFGFKCTYVTFGLLGIIIELVFVHNPYVYTEQKYRIIASAYFALLGGIINI